MIGRPFTSAPGKPAFGTFYESQNAGNYIENKRKRAMYCNPTLCSTTKSQGELLTLRYANYQAIGGCYNSFNKANLAVNLITKLDAPGICIIKTKVPDKCPANIKVGTSIYNYTIDPNGVLFGDSPCGLTNYTKYFVYERPKFLDTPIYKNSRNSKN
jgi:hypothetical protein